MYNLRPFLASLFFIFIVGCMGDPYNTIRNAEPGTIGSTIAKFEKKMSQEEFNKLIGKLINENMDLRSLGATITFVVDRKMCNFLTDIETKCSFLMHFPKDSIWSVQMRDNYIKQWSMNESGIILTRCEKLEELKRACR